MSSPIHPSPLPGGRLGGGWDAASERPRLRRAPIAHTTPTVPSPSLPSPPRPLPHVFSPQPLSVIPAQAGTRAALPHNSIHHTRAHRRHPADPHPHPSAMSSPIHPSPLPGGRLGGGWDAASALHQPLAPRPARPAPLTVPAPSLPSPPRPLRHPAPSSVYALPVTTSPSPVTPAPSPAPCPLHHSRAPLRHSCAGRNPPPTAATLPPLPSKSCYAHTRTGVPNHASLPAATTPPPSLPSFLRRQEHATLPTADQNLTALDARLTKVDKGCQNLTPLTPAPTPNPSKAHGAIATTPTTPPPPASTFAVNPSNAP